MPVVDRAPKRMRGECARLVVVETTSYQLPGVAETAAVPTRYGKWLESDEQPVIGRRVKIGTDWTDLSKLGLWLTEASLVILENPAPMFQAIPSPEALEEAYSQDLEWGVQVAEGLVAIVGPIPPGEAVRFNPGDLSTIRIRSRSNSAKCVISAFPK